MKNEISVLSCFKIESIHVQQCLQKILTNLNYLQIIYRYVILAIQRNKFNLNSKLQTNRSINILQAKNFSSALPPTFTIFFFFKYSSIFLREITYVRFLLYCLNFNYIF